MSHPTRDPDSDPRHDLDVRGPDERAAVIQLAARWAEMFAESANEKRLDGLERFRAVHDYVNAVIKGIELPGP